MYYKNRGSAMTTHFKLRAYGKINLGLDVLRKREDGYHEVKMIMQTVGLFDQIDLFKSGEPGIRIETNLPYLPVKMCIRDRGSRCRLCPSFYEKKKAYHLAAWNLPDEIPFFDGSGLCYDGCQMCIRDSQRGLFAIFHSALKNNGYLFLGKSETASEYAAVFKPVCAQEKIYIHKGEGKLEAVSYTHLDVYKRQADNCLSARVL